MARAAAMRPLIRRYAVSLCSDVFILLLVVPGQPLIGRMALPRLGGAPAVWNSAMLVYQAMLLAGYAYAHWLGRFAPRAQVGLQLSLFALAALLLPIGLISASPSPDADPFIWVPWLLLMSIGPLFFVVSSQAPVIQRWYALSTREDPYPLYAASNLGSFAGLLSYPLIVEPLSAIDSQSWTWTAGYFFLMLLVAWCALGLSLVAPAARPDGRSPSVRRDHAWIALLRYRRDWSFPTTLYLPPIGRDALLWGLPLSVTSHFTRRFPPGRPCQPITVLLPSHARGRMLLFSSRLAGIPIAASSVRDLGRASHQLFDRRHHTALTFFYR